MISDKYSTFCTVCADPPLHAARSFLLQLSLLDLECSALPASLAAAASLGNALELFGRDPWPAALRHYAAYTAAELAPARAKLAAVQVSCETLWLS